jgi:hypothetical protein
MQVFFQPGDMEQCHRRPTPEERSILDNYSNMPVSTAKWFTRPPAAANLSPQDLLVLITEQEGRIPVEFRHTVKALRGTRAARMSSPEPPTPEQVFVAAYKGQFARPSLQEQDAWRSFEPLKDSEAECTESVEQFTSRFMATKDIMEGITECTKAQIVSRYLDGVAQINGPLGAHVRWFILDQPFEQACNLQAVRLKVADLSAAMEILAISTSPDLPDTYQPAPPSTQAPTSYRPASYSSVHGPCQICGSNHGAHCWLVRPDLAPRNWRLDRPTPDMYHLFLAGHAATKLPALHRLLRAAPQQPRQRHSAR